MFGSKRAPALSGFSDQVETLIGKGTTFKGTINSGGTIRVDGKVEGEIVSKSDLVIGETGDVKANISGRNAMVAGIVHGNVSVGDKLELASSAKLFGDIKTGILIIGEGAIFKGACEMKNANEPERAKDNKDNKESNAKM